MKLTLLIGLIEHSGQLVFHTVNDLVLRYIRPQNNIILPTVPIASLFSFNSRDTKQTKGIFSS